MLAPVLLTLLVFAGAIAFSEVIRRKPFVRRPK